MDKKLRVNNKIVIIGIIAIVAIAACIVVGFMSANKTEEPKEAEPITKDNAAEVCKDFIAKTESLSDYVPDAKDRPKTHGLGKTKDDVAGFSTTFAASYRSRKGRITCLIGGTKEDPKVYSITFTGRQLYGDASSWMKSTDDE